MFAALLKNGVARDKIDGIPTDEMWKLYKQRELNKPKKKENSHSHSGTTELPEGTAQPSAPPLEP